MAKCPKCGTEWKPVCVTKDVVDDKIIYEEEFFCFNCNEGFYTQKTGTIVWD